MDIRHFFVSDRIDSADLHGGSILVPWNCHRWSDYLVVGQSCDSGRYSITWVGMAFLDLMDRVRIASWDALQRHYLSIHHAYLANADW